MLKLNQLVPQEACKACDGCCRYAQKNTSWAPLFLFEEIVELTEKNIVPSCLFTHAGAKLHHAARINVIDDGEALICPCFDKSSNRCKIYPDRPFDCRLYPFVLARKGKEAYLGVDEKCPYILKNIESAEFKVYVVYLNNFLLSSEFLKSVQNNPEIIQDYAADIRYLIALPMLTRYIN